LDEEPAEVIAEITEEAGPLPTDETQEGNASNPLTDATENTETSSDTPVE
jgi:hypothetical protein